MSQQVMHQDGESKVIPYAVQQPPTVDQNISDLYRRLRREHPADIPRRQGLKVRLELPSMTPPKVIIIPRHSHYTSGRNPRIVLFRYFLPVSCLGVDQGVYRDAQESVGSVGRH